MLNGSARGSIHRVERPPRSSSTLSLGGELAVLVEVRSEVGVQFGFVRSLGPSGCVLEVSLPPRLGSDVSVSFLGQEGSVDAPEHRAIEGYAQHAMLWRIGEKRRRVRRVMVKWSPCRPQDC